MIMIHETTGERQTSEVTLTAIFISCDFELLISSDLNSIMNSAKCQNPDSCHIALGAIDN